MEIHTTGELCKKGKMEHKRTPKFLSQTHTYTENISAGTKNER